MDKQWYELLFENYGRNYDNEVFTQGTAGECEFIEKEMEFDQSMKILDVGCGTGRHAIELTKRGYSITGIDFQRHDARNLIFTTLNGLFPLYHSVEEFTASDKEKGNAT